MGTQPVPDNVVLLRALELDHPQFGLGPVDAVPALGVADHLVGNLPGRFVVMGPAVVHPELLAVLENRVVETGIALPGRVVDNGHLAGYRAVQLQFGALHPVDQVLVDEQLAPRTNIDDFILHLLIVSSA